MTDARLPERYLNDRRIVRLSDADRSAYFMSLVWAVSNRTDGLIDEDDLPFIPTFDRSSVHALTTARLWTEMAPGMWSIADYLATQTTRAEFEVLENVRRAEREKKRRQRAARQSQGTVLGDVPRDKYPGTAQDRKEGQEGQAEDGAETSWPTRLPGSQEWAS